MARLLLRIAEVLVSSGTARATALAARIAGSLLILFDFGMLLLVRLAPGEGLPSHYEFGGWFPIGVVLLALGIGVSRFPRHSYGELHDLAEIRKLGLLSPAAIEIAAKGILERPNRGAVLDFVNWVDQNYPKAFNPTRRTQLRELVDIYAPEE